MPLSPNINNKEADKFVYKRGTRVRTVNINECGNALDVVVTGMSDTATKIELPEDAYDVIIRSSDTVYLGKDSSVTTSTGFPIHSTDMPLRLALTIGNNNALYGIMASGTANIYAAGVITE